MLKKVVIPTLFFLLVPISVFSAAKPSGLARLANAVKTSFTSVSKPTPKVSVPLPKSAPKSTPIAEKVTNWFKPETSTSRAGDIGFAAGRATFVAGTSAGIAAGAKYSYDKFVQKDTNPNSNQDLYPNGHRKTVELREAVFKALDKPVEEPEKPSDKPVEEPEKPSDKPVEEFKKALDLGVAVQKVPELPKILGIPAVAQQKTKTTQEDKKSAEASTQTANPPQKQPLHAFMDTLSNMIPQSVKDGFNKAADTAPKFGYHYTFEHGIRREIDARRPKYTKRTGRAVVAEVQSEARRVKQHMVNNIHTLNDQITELKRDKTILEDNLRQIRQQLWDAIGNVRQQLETLQLKYQEQITAVRSQLETAQYEKRTLETQLTEQQAAHTQQRVLIEQNSAENRRLQQTIEQLTAGAQAVQAEVVRLREQIEGLIGRMSGDNLSQQERDRLTAEKARLEAQLQQAMQQQQRLQEECTEQIARKQEEIDVIRRGKDQVESQIAGMQSQLTALRAELAAEKETSARSSREHASAVADLRVQKHAAEHDLREAQSTNRDLTVNLQQKEQTLARLQKLNRALSEQVAYKHGQLQTQEAELANKQRLINDKDRALEEQGAAHQRAKDTLIARNQELSDLLVQNEADRNRLQQQLRQIQAALAQKDAEIRQLQQRISVLEQLGSDTGALQQQLAAAQTERQQLEEGKQQLQQQLRDLNDQLTEQQATSAARETRAQEVVDENVQLSEELHNLRQQKEIVDRQIIELQQQLATEKTASKNWFKVSYRAITSLVRGNVDTAELLKQLREKSVDLGRRLQKKEQEISALQQGTRELSTQVGSQAAQLSHQQKELDRKNRALGNQTAQHTSRRDSLSKQTSVLAALLHEKETREQTLQQELAEMRSAIVEKDKKIQQLQEEIADQELAGNDVAALQQELDDAQAEQRKLKQKAVDLEGQLVGQQQATADATKKLDQSSADNKKLKQDIQDKVQESSKLLDKVTKVHIALQQSMSSTTSSQQEIANLKKEKARLEAALQKEEQKQGRLQTE